jgi:hypothetical protein
MYSQSDSKDFINYQYILKLNSNWQIITHHLLQQVRNIHIFHY